MKQKLNFMVNKGLEFKFFKTSLALRSRVLVIGSREKEEETLKQLLGFWKACLGQLYGSFIL